MATTPAATTIPMAALTYVRDALAEVPAVRTCRVGLETDISPEDYPIVRIVPRVIGKATAVRVSELVREIEALVYFGIPVQAFEAGAVEQGLEHYYAEIFELERDLIAALPREGAFLARYVETVTDEDRVAGYKLMAMRVLISGLV